MQRKGTRGQLMLEVTNRLDVLIFAARLSGIAVVSEAYLSRKFRKKTQGSLTLKA
jgi:arginine/ornithine N-succinyltransferase beta subunit